MSEGIEMLCNIELRKTWFTDAKELQQEMGSNANPWLSDDWDETDLSATADAVIVYGDALEQAQELGVEFLSQSLFDNACEALVAHLAMLWDLALPAIHGGSIHIDHPEHRGELDFHQLGMDTRSKSQWLETRCLDANGSRLMVTATDWWNFMWEEIEDMEARGLA